MDLLEEILERVTEIIRDDVRQEGDVYPPMAHMAAKRVLKGYNFTSTLVRDRLWQEVSQYEMDHGVFHDAYHFVCTSLPDIIGEFVKHQMGSEYQRLFDDRMFQLVPGIPGAE